MKQQTHKGYCPENTENDFCASNASIHLSISLPPGSQNQDEAFKSSFRASVVSDGALRGFAEALKGLDEVPRGLDGVLRGFHEVLRGLVGASGGLYGALGSSYGALGPALGLERLR